MICYFLVLIASDWKFFSDLTGIKVPLLKGGDGYQRVRLLEADSSKNIDVLIVGSSVGQSIDVRYFDSLNLRAFNISSASQSPLQSSYLLKKFQETFQPKLVIWDFHPFTFTSTGVESSIDLISNCGDCSDYIFTLLKTRRMYDLNIYFKKHLLKIFQLDDYKPSPNGSNVEYIKAGFVEIDLPAASDTIIIEPYTYQAEILQKKVFESELKKMRRKGIDVILVFSPKSASYYQAFLNRAEWFNYAENLVEKGLALDFINFNEVLPEFENRGEYFVDIGHLTKKGATEYNATLISQLKMRHIDALVTN
ncbi:hypothetical protein SAMN04488519_10773 [Algoriphagus ornithinivorans]|uniref:Uncharacterized protein n=1 Tax=Algoriphagus ornithinivorans TaxID=226506 RepID=A0A1I5HIQ1_9BACT|nr:hypothetical protein [Algoriphagus ornithinivorans]SFO48218.1 hypothetical protein SAMN04488519_10773 [Algoriphagus ornithinivorans]